jgi:hypothetical protein
MLFSLLLTIILSFGTLNLELQRGPINQTQINPYLANVENMVSS